MHEDETRQTSNRMPWEMNGHDEPTHVGVREIPDRGPDGGDVDRRATTQPLDPRTATTSVTQVEAPRQGRRWVIPVLLLLCGVCAFAIVTFFLTARHSSTSGGSSTIAAQSPSAVSSSSDDFPSDAVPSCISPDSDREVDNPLKDVARMREGAKTSCGFIAELRTRVVDQVTQEPGTSRFTLDVYSVKLTHFVTMTCDRHGHLTHCTGGTSANVWIKDSVN